MTLTLKGSVSILSGIFRFRFFFAYVFVSSCACPCALYFSDETDSASERGFIFGSASFVSLLFFASVSAGHSP